MEAIWEDLCPIQGTCEEWKSRIPVQLSCQLREAILDNLDSISESVYLFPSRLYSYIRQYLRLLACCKKRC